MNLLINKIIKYFSNNGLLYKKSNINIPIGACTFHNYTINFIKNAINEVKQSNIFFLENCYRPYDNYNGGIRCKNHTQLQILMHEQDGLLVVKKFLLFILGNNIYNNIDFFEDNWNSPTLSAYGYGWEVRLFQSLEVAQITYFKQFGGILIDNFNVLEITIGLDRIAMILQNDKFILCRDNIIVNEFENKYSDYSNKQIENEMNKLLHNKCQYKYNDFLLLNNMFNLLDSNNYFSIYLKNMYLLEISKIFKIIFNDIICNT